MPTKTIAELKALVDTRLPTNNAGAIDAATLRSVIDDILDNEQVALSGILTSSGTPNSTTFLRGDNVWAAPTTGGTFSGTGDPGLTRAQAAATTFTTPPAAIRTIGYFTAGDWGGATYLKVTAQPTHKGWFQTVDGTYYELYPDRGYVSPQMFGGKSPTSYNIRDNDIGPASNDAVDYIIFNRWGKVDLYYPPASYYIATTVQLKGGGFNVRGSNAAANGAGTYVMTDYYTTGFVGHHGAYSFDVFGSVYFNNRGIELGEMVYNGGLFGAHTYICVQAGTTSADGSGHPTGTGNGQIDGTVIWNYYREATRVELTGNAWGGEFSHMFMYSHYDGTVLGGSWLPQIHAPAPGPWSQKPSGSYSSAGPWKPAFGFLGRDRSFVHHCWFGGYSATGCIYAGNGDEDFPTLSGNVDYWSIEHCAFYYNAMDGAKNSHMNGNAGYMAHCDFSSNGRWGYRNQGFLGDAMIGLQSAFDGRASIAGNQRFPTSVAHAGYYYLAKLGRIGVSATPDYGAIAPTPGTSNEAWSFAGGDGTWTTDNWNYPDWVSGYTYEAGGCYGSGDINARHTWVNTYIEGGTWPAQFNSRDIVLGGAMGGQFIGVGSSFLVDGSWYNPVTYASRSNDYGVALGSGGTYQGVGEGILQWQVGGFEYSFRSDTYEGGQTFAGSNWCWAAGRYPNAWWIKQNQTSKSFGRSSASAVPTGSFAFTNMFIGSDGNCRQVDFMDAVPTSGTWAQGDYVRKRNAAVGSPKGWVCTVAGTPGTWVSEGNL